MSKTFKVVLAIAILVFIYSLFSILVDIYKNRIPGDFSLSVQARVLSINKRVLRGQSIGAFLSSASGSIQDDANILAVEFTVAGKCFLEDLKLNNAQINHFAFTKGDQIELIVNFNYDLRAICIRIPGVMCKPLNDTSVRFENSLFREVYEHWKTLPPNSK